LIWDLTAYTACKLKSIIIKQAFYIAWIGLFNVFQVNKLQYAHLL